MKRVAGVGSGPRPEICVTCDHTSKAFRPAKKKPQKAIRFCRARGRSSSVALAW